MKPYLISYLVLVLLGLVFNTISECGGSSVNKKRMADTGFILTIIGGAVLGVGFCAIDGRSSSGLYVYKVNGVTTSSGGMSASMMFIIGIVIGLFSNAISTWISQRIAERIRK